MGKSSFYPLLPLFALPLGACEGCIDLDDYRVVPPPEGGSSAGGAGGTSSVTCGTEEGRLFVVSADVGPGSAASGVCAADARPGIDLLAVQPRDGSCLARARVTSAAPDQIRVRSQVRHTTGNTLAVAGTFAGSALEFPLACSRSASVRLAAPPMGRALFAARVRLDGSTFCTEWAHRAAAEGEPADPAHASFEVHAFDQADDGGVLVGGALGGVLTRFEGGDGSSAVSGGPFFAVWTASGALQGVTALAAPPGTGDAVLAISAAGPSPVAAGAATLEDPACHACAGTTHVTDAALSCPIERDAGSDGGDAATDASDDASFDASIDDGSVDANDASLADADDDAPGADAGRDAELDAPAPGRDSVNAFVLAPRPSGGCSRFESFGSDRVGLEAQAIFGLSRSPSACRVYATGATGPDTWRTIGTNPRSTLPTNRDELSDGFLLRFGSGSTFGCTPSGSDFSLRLSAGSVVTGERVRASCRSGVTMGALVRDPVSGPLTIERCTSAAGCDAAAVESTLVPLLPPVPRLGNQLVVMQLDDTGELRWSGSFAQVSVDTLVPPAASGTPRIDLALDRSDDVYVLLVTTTPLRAGNLELSRCEELTAENPAPGVWLIKLSEGGFGDRGGCRWARRLG